MCGNLISLRRTVFQDWRLVKKSSSIDPETPERAIISVFKSYLVHLGSFKRHILYFCASIVEKIRSHWGEPYEAKFVAVYDICRLQTADCRLQIADCKLNDTKNLPNKGDVFKNIKSCESEKVALGTRLIFLCKVTLASYPKCSWLFFTDPLLTHPAYH